MFLLLAAPELGGESKSRGTKSLPKLVPAGAAPPYPQAVSATRFCLGIFLTIHPTPTPTTRESPEGRSISLLVTLSGMRNSCLPIQPKPQQRRKSPTGKPHPGAPIYFHLGLSARRKDCLQAPKAKPQSVPLHFILFAQHFPFGLHLSLDSKKVGQPGVGLQE